MKSGVGDLVNSVVIYGLINRRCKCRVEIVLIY